MPQSQRLTQTSTQDTVTNAMQRYAGEIYRLQEDHEWVSLSDLAEHIEASLQAISRMLNRLKQGGYLEHEAYKGVHLTDAGEQIAIPAIRRHRLIEVFLVKILEFGWHEVHAVSDRFEAGVDKRIEQRIFEISGRPTHCPHGEPIPTPDGIMPRVTDTSLVKMATGRTYRISRVRLHEPEKLQYLGELGLYPSTTFTLLSSAPFQGPVRIRLGRDEQVLGYELASALYVAPSPQGK